MVQGEYGLKADSTPRDQSFCQHALNIPKEVLVVEDSHNDERFKENPLVVGDPFIRFYAGVPLETAAGNILGTLCIIDNKPRTITEGQKSALQLIARKIMQHLETKKLLQEKEFLLEGSAERLKKLSDHAPGAIFQLEMKPSGEMYFPFLSKGFRDIHPHLEIKELRKNAALAFEVVHEEDLERLKQSLLESYANISRWSEEYRVVGEGNTARWHWVNAKPEKLQDGTVVWYGTFQDIDGRKEYITTLEQIIFDISHVMRRPVSSLLGLTETIDTFDLDKETLQIFLEKMRSVSKEMDTYIRKLNNDYTDIHNRVSSV